MSAERMKEAVEHRPPHELSNRELWRWRVGHSPDSPWLWWEDRTWTYAQFDALVQPLAGGLRELGVGLGTRVLVGMNNRPETVQVHLALGQLGAVVVPLLPGMPFEELLYPMRHSEAALLIADDPIASLAAEHRDACAFLEQIVVLDGVDVPGAVPFAQVPGEPPADGPLEGDSREILSYIVYTSGSTGRPKGVMLKAGNHYSCGLGYVDLYDFRHDDRYFLPLTMAHSLGSIAAMGIPMVSGGSLALTPRFRPSSFWDEVAASQATISVLFPAHLNLLLETAEGAPAAGDTSLRFVVTHADIAAFRDRFGVELGTIWGMTETTICVGSDPGHRGELGPGYVGHAMAGGELGIFDDGFNRLGPYRYGEVCLRHEQVMVGYLKDADATAAALVDGWVRSGDRGFVDNTGRAYFAGRYKAMIKRSGENISAEEVEAVLLEHPGVAECVVVAVPDRLRTEEVGAVVVRRSGQDASPETLREAASAKLVRWKLPRYVVVLDEPLPRLGNGKIDRVGTAALIVPGESWDAETA